MTEEKQAFAVVVSGVVGKGGANGLCGGLVRRSFSGGGRECCIGIGEDDDNVVWWSLTDDLVELVEEGVLVCVISNICRCVGDDHCHLAM